TCYTRIVEGGTASDVQKENRTEGQSYRRAYVEKCNMIFDHLSYCRNARLYINTFVYLEVNMTVYPSTDALVWLTTYTMGVFASALGRPVRSGAAPTSLRNAWRSRGAASQSFPRVTVGTCTGATGGFGLDRRRSSTLSRLTMTHLF